MSQNAHTYRLDVPADVALERFVQFWLPLLQHKPKRQSAESRQPPIIFLHISPQLSISVPIACCLCVSLFIPSYKPHHLTISPNLSFDKVEGWVFSYCQTAQSRRQHPGTPS